MVFARVFGICGIIANVLVFQQKDRRRLFRFKLMGDVVWTLHFLFLGAYSGAAIALIAFCRSIVFMHREKPWAQSRAWLYGFLGVSAASAFLTWQGPMSLLASAASMTAIVSFWIGKPPVSRLLSFPISACMLIYNASSGSVEGCACEILTILSSTVGYFRHDRPAARTRKAAEQALATGGNTHESSAE